MGVVIEPEIWEPNKAVYVFLFISSFFSIFLFPARTAANVFDHAPPVSFLRFQRDFLLLYSLSSVTEGLWVVFGEYEFAYYGLNKEQMLVSLCVGCAISLFIGSFIGVLSDLVGHKKLCLLFYMLHLFVGVCKMVNGTPAVWLASICLSLASSIFSFSFETWMVVEHDKLGQRQDSLNHMFWLMTFFESASFIGSQVLGNYLIDGNIDKNIKSIWKVDVVLVVVAIIYFTRGWKEAPKRTMFKDYGIVFHRHILCDKSIWLLSLAQASVHFSATAFWLLWAPTIVADGREVSLGLIYPCMLGSKILGSTGFPWFIPGSLALRTEEYLVYVFIIMGTTLSIVAYDYQEIGLLVTLFCIFHACMGLVMPSLARLRTIYVPNEVRGGMMTLSLAPASAAFLVLLMLRGYYHYVGNSTFTAFAALGLFSAAGCMYVLKKWGKQLHQSRHNL